MQVGNIIKDPETGYIYKCTEVFLYFGIMAVRWTQGRWNENAVHVYSPHSWKKVMDPSMDPNEFLKIRKHNKKQIQKQKIKELV